MHVPVIDFADFSDGPADATAALAQQLATACRDSGFFMLANHGLDTQNIERAFAMAAAFFDLPTEQKQAISIDRSPCHRGWYGDGGEVLDARTQPQGDAKEGLKIGRDLSPSHPLVVAGTPLHGPNQWPQDWHEAARFKSVMQAFYAACEALSRRLMAAFALSLDLPHSYFEPMLRLPMATLSPLRYPPGAGGRLGAGAHSDFGCLTLLLQRDEAGLEIECADGSWQGVPCTPDLVTVNIGDMMARWTNNRYASTRHRVVNKSGRVRHSMAFFFDPDYDADLTPLPGCLAEGDEPHFAPATCLDHLLMKIDESFTYRQDAR